MAAKKQARAKPATTKKKTPAPVAAPRPPTKKPAPVEAPRPTKKKPAPVAAPAPKPVAFAPRKSTPVKPPPKPAAPPPKPAAPAAPAVDHGARIAALWARLEAWIAATGAPPLALAAPASEKAIKAAEKELGRAFPDDVRAALRLHDGQDAKAAKQLFPWLPGCPPLYPVATIVAEHKKLLGAPRPKTLALEPTQRVWSGPHPQRIPLADGTFIDFHPGPAGTAGQLITLVDRTHREFVLVDVSFTAALERWVTVLERGIWVYDAARHAVHPRLLAAATGHPAGWFSKRAA